MLKSVLFSSQVFCVLCEMRLNASYCFRLNIFRPVVGYGIQEPHFGSVTLSKGLNILIHALLPEDLFIY
jgi:hypothetical protein